MFHQIYKHPVFHQIQLDWSTRLLYIATRQLEWKMYFSCQTQWQLVCKKLNKYVSMGFNSDAYIKVDSGQRCLFNSGRNLQVQPQRL